jgi:uncharacterized membrane protein
VTSRRLLVAFCPNCGTQIADGTACPKCAGAVAAATAPAAGAPAATGAGLADNVAGALAYLFIPAIVFLVMEPYNKNRFIRFHCFQDLFFVLGTFVFGIAMMFLAFVLAFVPILRSMVGFLVTLVDLGFFVIWLVLLLKAFQGQTFKLPVIGDLAEKQANTV